MCLRPTQHCAVAAMPASRAELGPPCHRASALTDVYAARCRTVSTPLTCSAPSFPAAALGLSSHWQPPREAPPSPVAPELPPAEAEPGAEVSRFGRRVRRRKYEGSDFDESGEETWVEGSPTLRDPGPPGDNALVGGSAGPSLLGLAHKRQRASAGGSPRDTPPLGGGPTTVVSGSDWRAALAQHWPAQAGVAGGPAGQAGADPIARVVVRQLHGPRHPHEQRGLAALQSGAPPPAARLQRPSEALAFAARFAGSRSASPPLQQAASVPAPLAPAAMRLPSGSLQLADSVQLPRSLSAVLPRQESTNLCFYEQQQRLYLQKRQEWEQERKREIQQRLAELQGRQAAAARALASLPPPPAHQMPGASQPQAALPTAVPPRAGVPPANAPPHLPISSMGHLSAQEWAQHILPPEQQQQQQQGLAPLPRGAAYSGPAASPYAALASPAVAPQLLASAGHSHQPGGMRRSLSQELHGLYSAWSDSQLSLHLGGGLH